MHMCQWTEWSLVQAMVCHLFSTKPSPEPMILQWNFNEYSRDNIHIMLFKNCIFLYFVTPQWVNPSDVETRISWENQVNTISAGALAPCITKTSATMVSTMQSKCILVMHRERFQLPAPSQCWEITTNVTLFYVFWNNFSTRSINIFEFAIFRAVFSELNDKFDLFLVGSTNICADLSHHCLRYIAYNNHSTWKISSLTKQPQLCNLSENIIIAHFSNH